MRQNDHDVPKLLKMLKFREGRSYLKKNKIDYGCGNFKLRVKNSIKQFYTKQNVAMGVGHLCQNISSNNVIGKRKYDFLKF